MSLSLEYTPTAFDLSQLHDELVRAGLVPEAVRSAVVTVLDPPPAGPPDLQTEHYVLTVFLTMPDGTAEADVDAVVAAHVPQARYDPATRRGEVAAAGAQQRRRALLRGTREAVRGAADLASLRAATLRVVDLVEEVG